MFHVITTATIEMTLAAVAAAGHLNALSHLGPLDARFSLEHDRAGLIAFGGRCLVVGAGGFMADKTIDIILVAEIKV